MPLLYLHIKVVANHTKGSTQKLNCESECFREIHEQILKKLPATTNFALICKNNTMYKNNIDIN
jgi:hypothetical protein